MRSFALWYSTKDKESKLDKEITVHVNLWNKKKENQKNYCFDFGLLVEDIKSIEKIYLYVPFKIEKSQIKDLGAIISNNQLVNAIFNENFTTTDGKPKKLIVNETVEKPKFVIYALEVESQIKINPCIRNASTPGTILEIDTGSINLEKILRYYFRIRIQVGSDDLYMINDEIKGVSIFSDQFTNTEVIDFRLNDVRSCSEELREQFNKGKKFNILAVHYLILRNADDVIIHYGKEINSRMLENDLWKDYIEGDNHNIIAYHIKNKAKKKNDNTYDYIEDFSDLTRFQYQKGTKLIIIMYVLGIIILGTIGGVVGNWLSHLIGL
ncbi:hypothetical protein CLOACE_19810 [Clostridium acetireducens DSM 10703]|uniref:Uncharacterized protein n=1 Tax=Clostridium acetireducens DSM 10703 TaxID=1121290 RepID=A0A1E8EWL6_9CLOT|nr:hypothetical protein [Clostridium acetireducens]OFI05012.1 hypothetical protein CLOACE_19810 [Clostridium acetireducens DSM 10703]